MTSAAPTHPNIARKARTQLVLTSTILLLLAVTGFVLVITHPRFDGLFFAGFGLLMLLVSTTALWVLLITYAVFALNNERRRAALVAAHPDATLVHTVITVPVLRQLRALATTLGMPRPKLHARTYVTLAVDPSKIVFYAGANPPVAQLSLPTGSLTAADLTTTAAAGKQLPSIRLAFAATPDAPITLVPVYWPGVTPKPVPQDVLAAQIAAINAARETLPR